jgi:hypothetical protein
MGRISLCVSAGRYDSGQRYAASRKALFLSIDIYQENIIYFCGGRFFRRGGFSLKKYR